MESVVTFVTLKEPCLAVFTHLCHVCFLNLIRACQIVSCFNQQNDADVPWCPWWTSVWRRSGSYHWAFLGIMSHHIINAGILLERPHGQAMWRHRSPEIMWRKPKNPANNGNWGDRPMTSVKWLSQLPAAGVILTGVTGCRSEEALQTSYGIKTSYPRTLTRESWEIIQWLLIGASH